MLRAARELARRPRDLRLRLRRRPRPRQAAADGADRRRARRRRDRHVRQPAQRGSARDHRGDPRRAPATLEVEPTAARRSSGRSSWRAPGDVVVIAGKGHEQGQEIAGVDASRSTTARSRARRCARLGPPRDPARLDELAGARRGSTARVADEVTGVQVDSRGSSAGDLFVAVGGGRRVRRRRARARRGRDARPGRCLRRARRARAAPCASRSAARVVGDHGLDGQDVDEGHPRGALRAAAAHDRRRGELQQRDRRAADALPARAGHRGLHPRARDARLRPDRRAVRVARPDVGVDHERSGRCTSSCVGSLEGVARAKARADRRAAAGRDGGRPGRALAVARDDIDVVPLRRGRRRRRAFEPPRCERRSAASSQLHRAAPGARTRAARSPRSTRSGCPAPSGESRSSSPRWRGEECELPGGGLLINDAYNANPVSMRAALEHLRARRGPPRASRSSATWPSSARRRPATTAEVGARRRGARRRRAPRRRRAGARLPAARGVAERWVANVAEAADALPRARPARATPCS